jgi:hypothetical protein
MIDLFENESFVPIVVNKQGEAIRPNNLNQPEGSEFFREQLHLRCGGLVKISTVSEGYKVLYCGKCGLRRYFPAKVETYAQLRAHFKKALRLRNPRKTTRKK